MSFGFLLHFGQNVRPAIFIDLATLPQTISIGQLWWWLFYLEREIWAKNWFQFFIDFFWWVLWEELFSLLPSYFISLSLFLISFSWMLWWRTGKIPDKHLTLKLDLFPYSIYCNLFEVSMSVVLTNVRFQKTNWLNYGKCT